MRYRLLLFLVLCGASSDAAPDGDFINCLDLFFSKVYFGPDDVTFIDNVLEPDCFLHFTFFYKNKSPLNTIDSFGDVFNSTRLRIDGVHDYHNDVTFIDNFLDPDFFVHFTWFYRNKSPIIHTFLTPTFVSTGNLTIRIGFRCDDVFNSFDFYDVISHFCITRVCYVELNSFFPVLLLQSKHVIRQRRDFVPDIDVTTEQNTTSQCHVTTNRPLKFSIGSIQLQFVIFTRSYHCRPSDCTINLLPCYFEPIQDIHSNVYNCIFPPKGKLLRATGQHLLNTLCIRSVFLSHVSACESMCRYICVCTHCCTGTNDNVPMCKFNKNTNSSTVCDNINVYFCFRVVYDRFPTNTISTVGAGFTVADVVGAADAGAASAAVGTGDADSAVGALGFASALGAEDGGSAAGVDSTAGAATAADTVSVSASIVDTLRVSAVESRCVSAAVTKCNRCTVNAAGALIDTSASSALCNISIDGATGAGFSVTVTVSTATSTTANAVINFIVHGDTRGYVNVLYNSNTFDKGPAMYSSVFLLVDKYPYLDQLSEKCSYLVSDGRLSGDQRISISRDLSSDIR